MTEPESFYAIRLANGEMIYDQFSWMSADGPDDWTVAEEGDHDEPTEYEIVRMHVESVRKRTFPPQWPGMDERFSPEVTNFDDTPATDDTPARDISVGDWVLVMEDGEQRFEEVTSTLHWGRDDITVMRGDVGDRVDGCHVYPVAVDPDWARDWQARRTQ